MVKRKNKLVIEPFDDIKIIGINTSMQDFQLAHFINKALKIDLVKYKSITNNGEDFYSFYRYAAAESEFLHFLTLSIQNQDAQLTILII